MSRPHPPIRARAEPTPFWRRPGEVARYPLRGDALLTLLVLTAFGVLAWLPGAGWLFAIVAYFCGYKYAFEVLLATAHGHREAPVLVVLAENGTVWRLLGVLFVLLLCIKLSFAAGEGWLGWLALAWFAFLQPSMLASLATSGRLLGALNPANAFRLIGRIGGIYFLLSAALFLAQSMVLVAGRILVPVLPGFIAALLVDAVFYWALFASFHLLGLAMYQFHDDLGYTPSRHIDELPTTQDRDQVLLDQADVLAGGGDLPGAIRLLREELRERPVTPAVHERYRQLLRQDGDAATLDAHALQYLGVLLREEQERRALGLLREALDASPGFALADIEQGEWLARRALELGQSRLACDALRSLLRADPRHPDAPSWAMQAAGLLHERLGDLPSARVVLASARDACRDEAGIARLDSALAALPGG